MPEINKNNFSKLCEEKGELLSKELRDQILEQEFMRNSKFPIIYGSEIILQCNPESTRKFIQELFCSSVSEESIAGTSAFVENHIKEFGDLKEGHEKVLEGYVIAVDSFTLVRIDYRIWARKCGNHYLSAAVGIRGVLDVRRTQWSDFLSAYMEILNLGLPKNLLQEEKQKQTAKCVKKARLLFMLFNGEIMKEMNKIVCDYT